MGRRNSKCNDLFPRERHAQFTSQIVGAMNALIAQLPPWIRTYDHTNPTEHTGLQKRDSAINPAYRTSQPNPHSMQLPYILWSEAKKGRRIFFAQCRRRACHRVCSKRAIGRQTAARRNGIAPTTIHPSPARKRNKGTALRGARSLSRTIGREGDAPQG